MKKLLLFPLLLMNFVAAAHHVVIVNRCGSAVRVVAKDSAGMAVEKDIPHSEFFKFELDQELREVVIDDCPYDIRQELRWCDLYIYTSSGYLIPRPLFHRDLII